MPISLKTLGEAVWDLPPLILHPFNERVPPSALLENSKAALIMAGLIPDEGSDWDELTRRLLTGRHGEIRMLYYLGKDIRRWLGQCRESASRIPELYGAEIHEQSFAGLLTGCPPQCVKEKLVRWGVVDYVTVFSRAIGLTAVLAQAPAFESLAEEFLRNYHRYSDAMYRCYMESQPHLIVKATNFRFELYASGEYSRLLESEWGSEQPS